jgi:hypothetical protein
MAFNIIESNAQLRNSPISMEITTMAKIAAVLKTISILTYASEVVSAATHLWDRLTIDLFGYLG